MVRAGCHAGCVCRISRVHQEFEFARGGFKRSLDIGRERHVGGSSFERSSFECSGAEQRTGGASQHCCAFGTCKCSSSGKFSSSKFSGRDWPSGNAATDSYRAATC
jgi:hypothetical protein